MSLLENTESLILKQGGRFVVTMINPHYRDSDDKQKIVTKNQFRNPDSFEDIKRLVELNQEDIIHDTVSNKKYKCYF